MSDSENPSIPSEAALSRALRDIVIATYTSGNTDELTVKRLRARAEETLGLSQGFLKADQKWKQKSHDMIHEAVVSFKLYPVVTPSTNVSWQEKYCNDEAASKPKPKSSPKAPKPKPKAAPKKAKPSDDSPHGVKRKASATAKKPKKKRKTESSGEESDAAPVEDSLSEAEHEPPRKLVQRKRKVVAEDSEDEEADSPNGKTNKSLLAARIEGDEAEDGPSGIEEGDHATSNGGDQAEKSESELSSLIDELPVKRKRQKKLPPAKRQKGTKAKEPKTARPAKAAKSKTSQDDDPDQAEIKRLQSWLVKCGVRKVWSKELARYDTSKEKIKHLKSMLKDVGMEGKFSVEKAARIKEQREFAKDLEAIQEGERSWGKVDDVGETGRPRRRAAAASATRKPVVQKFGSDDDDDEDGENDQESDDKDDHDEDDGDSQSEENGDDSEEDSE
jgi:hypothetical protein